VPSAARDTEKQWPEIGRLMGGQRGVARGVMT